MSVLLALLLLLAQQEDSPLVKAAKAAGGPHKPAGKVITNAEVKKGAAKPATAATPATTTAVAPAPDTTTPSQKLDAQRRARVDAVKRAEAADTKVAQLEAELRRLELAYYDESDLNKRDTVLVQRFEQTKKQLDDARAELADARDALTKLQ